MTGQCRKCLALIDPAPMRMLDPDGVLALRALADGIYNHYTLHHPDELKLLSGVQRILEARSLVGLVDCADPAFIPAVKTLTGVICTIFTEKDKELEEAGMIVLKEPPAFSPPGFLVVEG